MLGLSATPNRPDGLTKVLKWHIGDIIDIKCNISNYVSVDIKRFVLNFDKTSKIKLLTTKSKSFVGLITNILSFDIRNEIIVNCILDEYKNNNDRQFLVMSDRVNHLMELGTVLKKNNFQSVGYIIGKMSQEEIKKTESCTIILATYSMVNEGLDIPSLNCLVLASPKIEIEQTIGRISRLNNNDFKPLVLDFIDILPTFVSEARKRLIHYKKKKYNINDYIYNSDEKVFKENLSIDDNDNYDIYSLDCSEKVDTEYNNINAWNNGKIKINNKTIPPTKVEDTKKSDIDSLFEAFSKL